MTEIGNVLIVEELYLVWADVCVIKRIVINYHPTRSDKMKKKKKLEELYMNILRLKIEAFAIECNMTSEEVINELLWRMNQRNKR